VAWVEKLLRGTRVWMQSDEAGNPLPGSDERVEILYKPGGKPYRASLRNLASVADARPVTDEALAARAAVEDDAPRRTKAATTKTKTDAEGSTRAKTKSVVAANAVHVYTDGACTGNPGPMGIGIVIADPASPAGSTKRELSRYLGQGTNNIAELTAIEVALESLSRDRPVVVYSDSSYAIGLLASGWRARANQELVARLRALLAEFPRVSFVKVAGHSGHPENERCDELARAAIIKRSPTRH
jgi:ribonuclease HI